MAANEAGAVPHRIDTPFGPTSDAILETNWHGVPVLLLSRHGPGHLFNPSRVPYRANIFALKHLGCTHIIASGAVGSLREEYRPQDLVIADQVIDQTRGRQSTFFDHAAVHVEFAHPFDEALRAILLEAAKSLPTSSVDAPKPSAIHDGGTYVCMEGPAFSSRAESLMHRILGGDLIGMTALPEAKLAREAEIAYALVALVTDYDCWKPPAKDSAGVKPDALLAEILGNLKSASGRAMDLMRHSVRLMADRRGQIGDSPAHHALELGIWSNRDKIDPAEVQRLAPLWIKYIEGPRP